MMISVVAVATASPTIALSAMRRSVVERYPSGIAGEQQLLERAALDLPLWERPRVP
jgi:hypothetical protein